jgi:hypothetical protein
VVGIAAWKAIWTGTSSPGREEFFTCHGCRGRIGTMFSINLEQLPATDALRQSPIASLRDLALQETTTTVTIEGSVPSYYLKQLAQETVLPVLAGRQLLNRVSVVRHAEPAS